MPNKSGDRVTVHYYTVTYRRDDAPGDRTMLVCAFNRQRAMNRVAELLEMRQVTGSVLDAQYVRTSTALVIR